MFEIDEGGALPKVFLEFFAADDFAGAFQQEGKNLEGFALEPDAGAEFKKIAGGGLELEGTESGFCVRSRFRSHKGVERRKEKRARPFCNKCSLNELRGYVK